MADSNNQFTRVALVLPTEFAYAREVMRGVIAATRARNLYGPTPSGKGRPKPWLFRVYRGIYGHSSKYLAKWFKDWDPHGIICQIYDDRLAKVYRDTGRPVVELFESRADSEFPRVMPDDVAAGEMAAAHFVERGFRHFAFFGVPWMLWSREREQGFCDGVRKAFAERAARNGSDPAAFTFAAFGQPNDDRKLRQSRRRRAEFMGTWLCELPKPLAVFVANDLWGSEVVQAARQTGFDVPGEVAVLGVDNEELLCEITHPPLSSIRLGTEQIGHTAVTLLDRLLQRKPPGSLTTRVPPVGVITRQSTEILAVEDREVAAALAYIRQNAAHGVGVKQLLTAVPVNRRTLERRFVNLLGHTPLEEIHRIRVERVKALLRIDMPIYDVARRCGYSTPEHMATSFHKMVGLTPTAFRKAHLPWAHWERGLPPV